MPDRIEIDIQGIALEAELEDLPAARWLGEKLPLELDLSRWGDEYYGSVPDAPAGFEGPAKTVMEVGDLAFWPPGGAFCIFFGPTPASDSQAPVAAGPVKLLGKARGDWEAVKALGGSVRVKISAA